MKVLYIHHCGTSTGAGKSLLFLLEELKTLGVEIHVVTVEGPIVNDFKEITDHVYTIRGIPQLISIQGLSFFQSIFTNLKSIAYLNQSREILKWVDTIKPDIIHFNEIGMFHTSNKLLDKYNIPIIFHVRILPKVRLGFIYYLYKFYSDHKNIHLFCISRKIFNLFQSTENRYLLSNPMIKSDHRAIEYKVNSDEVLKVYFVANFIKYKGVDELIDVIIGLKDHREIEIHIFGSNVKNRNFHDSKFGKILDSLNLFIDYEKRIHNIISKNSVRNTIYHGHRSDVEEQLLDADILIAPTRLNEIPRAVYEAGMLGVPSIVALKDSQNCMIKNFENGVIVEEKNSTAIIETILHLEQNRDVLKQMGENAKKLFEISHEKRKVAEKTLNIYSKLLNENAE